MKSTEVNANRYDNLEHSSVNIEEFVEQQHLQPTELTVGIELPIS